MSFRGVFIAVFLGTAMIVAAFVVNSRRPEVEVRRATPAMVKATGRCAQCHEHETGAVVHEFEMSAHSAAGLTCLDCHKPLEGQEVLAHQGFEIARETTSLNCAGCHKDQYDQYLRSRHAAPSWAAVTGSKDFTAEQIAFGEQHHPGWVDRDAHALVDIQGPAAITSGCQKCHDIGKPNKDGSIGSCTDCHARHIASIEQARTPQTCGQCHMGPDHSQIEIYNESKHGVLFHAQRERMNLKADPETLSSADMPVPTCSTCHMSGIGRRLDPTHDVGERLSYFLFADVSDRREDFRKAQVNMKAACLECHTNNPINEFYREAESVVKSTNSLVKQAREVIDGLRKDGLLTPEPFDEPIEFAYFDLWHYYGRTAKHGAFMGGADFVQWHGFYELVNKLAEIKHQAAELRGEEGTEDESPSDAAADAE
jgi:hypothetical protein